MTDIESLCRLTEAVEAAGADIAPTYLEYVQLSFAIATDCGEAGRDFFHRLCRVSPKYQREHAERVFSNALHTQRGEVHLGTAFHLAEATGVSICIEEMPKHPTGTKGTAGTARKFPPHTGAYNKVGNDNISEEREGEEELLPGSEPQHQLPTFPKNNWPEFLQRIIKAGSSPIQHDIMLLGALTALGACMSRHVRCLYGGKYHHPSLQCFVVAPSTKHHGLRRNRTYLRSGSGHPFHRHRIGSRSLERYPAQSVRPRPLVLQPPHRPGIPGSEEKLSFRPDFGYAVAGANFHSDGRRRIILPPIILLHVRNQ